MTAHDEMLDNVAAYALGVLPPGESDAVAAHVAGCKACHDEYRALLSAVTAVAYAAEAGSDPASGPGPSALLKARIMRRVRREADARPVRWLSALAAAAVIAAVLAGIGDLVLARRAQELHSRLALRDRELADLIAGDARRYPFARGEVLARGARLYLALRGLPPPPKGKVYQAWTLAAGAKRMSPSLTFLPSSNGVVMLALPVDARTVAAVAVSIEPAGGSLQPTSAPVALVRLRS
jgi:anti-sigma-K factor RskA